jgi:hypothetical protein
MLRYFPPEKRRRLAPLFLVAGMFTVGKLAYEEIPRGQDVRYVLPGTDLAAFKVSYTAEDEFYGGIERRFPNGSPREVVHTPSLSPGHYNLSIELTSRGGEITRLTRTLSVPTEGAARIRLVDSD